MTMDAMESRPTTARRFTLLDGMILVAAAAVGLAVTRRLNPAAGSEWWDMLKVVVANFAWDGNLFDQIVPELMMFAMPTAVALTLGVLVLRLRKPRPGWRRLTRQPGLVACLAMLLGWAAGMAFAVVNVLSIDRNSGLTITTGLTYAQEPFSWLMAFSDWGSLLGGFAVVVAWATLLLIGRWRAEPTWLDRLGRLVGLAWIAMALGACYAMRNNS